MLSSTTSLRLLASVAMIAGLSACGGGDKPAETTEAPAATQAPAPAEEAAPADAAAEAAAPAAEVTYASLTGDAAKGEKVFAQCRACHVAEPGVNRVGPSLWGVVGRTAGSIEGFRYSKANQNSGLVWSEEQLFTYLEAPQRTIPGTIMAFGGLKNPQDRADIIAFLKTKA
jgi:cytochrome c